MIKRKHIRTSRSVFGLLWMLPAFCYSGMQGMEALTDSDLAEVTGQALFVSDRIAATGAGTGATPTDFTFHRMGLDVELALNANIDKLQLGCGGFNESIAANACDIDLDFVRFMGRNGSQPGNPVTSDFKMLRPYIELAIINENSPSLREVVGVKIGAQSVDGFLGVGRDYLNTNGTPSGLTNAEHGGVCNATDGAGAQACHSGINRISGSLGAELSAQVPLTVELAFITLANETVCLGNTSFTNDVCGAGDEFFTTITGTRLATLDLQSIPLQLSGGLISTIGIDEGYAWITESLRFVHGFSLEDTSDFFISFQRQRVAFPTYDKTGFSTTANAGWWMNVPSVKILDMLAPRLTLGVAELLPALLQPGASLQNIELGQRAVSNCFGGLQFC